MENQMRKQNMYRRWRTINIILAVLLGCCILVFSGMMLYINHYYHAGEEALECIDENVLDDSCFLIKENDWIAFCPEEIKVGFILYPGAKVEYTAYAPLLKKLAGEGILCVLPHLTGNIAFLEMNAADGIQEKFPEVESWYLGGHSLGGVVASSYIKKHSDQYDGIVFLASYPIKNLKESDIKVLSIYGDQDHVLNLKEYQESMEKYAGEYTEFVIAGGNHAQFGDYGEQNGDGAALITQEEQLDITALEISRFVKE